MFQMWFVYLPGVIIFCAPNKIIPKNKHIVEFGFISAPLLSSGKPSRSPLGQPWCTATNTKSIPSHPLSCRYSQGSVVPGVSPYLPSGAASIPDCGRHLVLAAARCSVCIHI